MKLNLRNPAVVDYLLDTVRFWRDEFGVDGLRLDVAYCLDEGFLRRLREYCDGLAPDFFLMGETLHGDYNRWVGDGKCHSCTNYECYKGLYSSLNDMNLFEIGPQPAGGSSAASPGASTAASGSSASRTTTTSHARPACSGTRSTCPCSTR